MSRKFGFELLRWQALQRAEDYLDEWEDRAEGDTPIEKIFAVALRAYVKLGFCEFAEVFPLDDLHWTLKKCEKVAERVPILVIESQKEIDDWRVDFVIHALDYNTITQQQRKWKSAIVECDGHDFHERDKKQAARDRSRDRRVQAKGFRIFRFTGHELWNDPLACAQEVVDWASGVACP